MNRSDTCTPCLGDTHATGIHGVCVHRAYHTTPHAREPETEPDTSNCQKPLRAASETHESPSITRKRKCRGRQEHDADGYTGAMQKDTKQKTLGSRKRNEPEQRPRARVLSAHREPEHNAKAEMPRQEKARRRQYTGAMLKGHGPENPLGPGKGARTEAAGARAICTERARA